MKHLPTALAVQLHYGGVGSTKCCLTAISIFLLIASVDEAKRIDASIEYASWFDIGQHTGPVHSLEASAKAPFRCNPKSKNFQDFSSHRILQHMYGVLNVDKKKLITQLAEKP